MRSPEEFYAHVRGLGYSPRTVIDVGVNYGTPELYQAFPDAYYHFVEPLAEREARLIALTKKYRGQYHLVAAGREDATLEFLVPVEADGASLVFSEVSDRSRLRKVDVKPLDQLVDIEVVDRPILIKTDCQGADIDVILGAPKLVAAADLVVMEVQMFRAAGIRKENEFTYVVRTMHEFGFVAYDFIGYYPRPRDGALGHTNIAFVRENGLFRSNHKWA